MTFYKKVNKKNWVLLKGINELGMSTQQAADALEISRTTLYALVNNRRVPKLSTALKISEFLDVPVEELFIEVMLRDGAVAQTEDPHFSEAIQEGTV